MAGKNRMRQWGLLLYILIMLAVGCPITHAQQRPDDKNGFTWVTWLTSGERIWKTVMRIEPRMKDVIGDGRTVAVAVQDIDYDGQNDIILNFWGADDCGADGCLYVVLTYNGDTRRAFVAQKFERAGHGLRVDGRYYKL